MSKPTAKQALEAMINRICERGMISAADRDRSVRDMLTDESEHGVEFREAVSAMVDIAYDAGFDDGRTFDSAPVTFTQVPEGMVLVPKEPTEEMLTAFNAWGVCAGFLPEAYRAMIEVVSKK